jgi:hypothetical protein
MIFGISGWWIILAVAAYFGVGALWYSNSLWARQWLHELGKQRDELESPQTAMVATLGAIVILVVIEAYFVQTTGTSSWLRGGYLGAKLWLGFALTTALINNAFQGASKKLLLIDQGYHLIGIVLAGAILAH